MLVRDTGPVAPEELELCYLEDGNTEDLYKCDDSSDETAQKIVRVEQERMGRKPVTELLVLSLNGARTFDLNYAVSATGLNRRKCLRALRGLAQDGYLELLDQGNQPGGHRMANGPTLKNPKFRVARNPAERRHRRPKKDCKRDKIWRVVRQVRRFTTADLIRQCEGIAGSGAVQDFVALLRRRGYLQVDEILGRRKILVLADDPGPNRPNILERKKGEKNALS
jgi:hypothetical protein